MRNVKGRIERATVAEVVPEINKTVGDELVEKLKEELFDPTPLSTKSPHRLLSMQRTRRFLATRRTTSDARSSN